MLSKADSATFQVEAQLALVMNDRHQTEIRTDDNWTVINSYPVIFSVVIYTAADESTTSAVNGSHQRLGQIISVKRHRLVLMTIVSQQMMRQSDERQRSTPWVPALRKRNRVGVTEVNAHSTIVTISDTARKQNTRNRQLQRGAQHERFS